MLHMVHKVGAKVRPLAAVGPIVTVHLDNTKPVRDRRGNYLAMDPDLADRGETPAEDEGEPMSRSPSTGSNPRRKGTPMTGDVYLVDSVVDIRTDHGGIQFLVKWEGYEEPTWIAEHDTDMHFLVEEFFRDGNPMLESIATVDPKEGDGPVRDDQ